MPTRSACIGSSRVGLGVDGDDALRRRRARSSASSSPSVVIDLVGRAVDRQRAAPLRARCERDRRALEPADCRPWRAPVGDGRGAATRSPDALGRRCSNADRRLGRRRCWRESRIGLDRRRVDAAVARRRGVVSVVNSIALRKAISLRASGSAHASVVERHLDRHVVDRACTSCFEMRAFSAFSISASRRLGCLISPARASSVSRSPYSLISCAAVLTPMPGTPGTLSTVSPASACTSTTLSGGTPNFSITSAGRSALGGGRCLHGVEQVVHRAVGSTSCIRSLSDETMVTSAPASRACRHRWR